MILVCLTCLPDPAWSQSLNYSEIFGDDWKKAQLFIDDNRSWMEPALKKYNISYPLAIAVIFPELVRYSALRDKMEITLLKTLYVSLGQEYANFSVGHLQMKPSFAEMVRNEAASVLGKRSGISFSSISEYDDIRNYRKSIIADLENPETEFNYLIAFLKICEKKFKYDKRDKYYEVRFLSTAYNYGLNRSKEQIVTMMDEKFFNTKLFKTENYSYSQVSLYWYQEYISSVSLRMVQSLHQ